MPKDKARQRPRNPAARPIGPPPASEPRAVQPDLAKADNLARTGHEKDPVRNTPPAGAWNDTSHD